jgi:hypothetical protein
MIVYWPWGLTIAGLVTVTIWMNGRHWRPGWLVGAGAQLAQIGFGAATGIWTFYFAALPLGMFLWNWWKHPQREKALRRRYGGVLVDVAGTDQMIVMSRGVLDRMIESAPRVPDPISMPMRGEPWLLPTPRFGDILSHFGSYAESIADMADKAGKDTNPPAVPKDTRPDDDDHG